MEFILDRGSTPLASTKNMINITKITKKCLQLYQKGKRNKNIQSYINKKRIDDCNKLYIRSCHAYNTGEHKECLDLLYKLVKKYNKFDSKLYTYNLQALQDTGNDKDIANGILITKSLCSKFEEEQKSCIIDIFNKEDMGSCFESLHNISNVNSFDRKVVTNCLYDGCSSGIGDFLRGSCFLFEILNPYNVEFHADISNHVIHKYLHLDSNVKIFKDDIFDTEKLAKRQDDYIGSLANSLKFAFNSDSYDINLFTHMSDLLYAHQFKLTDYKLSGDCRKFFQNKISFDDSVVNKARSLINKDYDLIHFRCGDYELVEHRKEIGFNNQNYNVNYEDCLQYVKDAQGDKPLVVLSDSNMLKEYLIKHVDDNVKIFHTDSCHSSINPGFVSNVSQSEDKMFYVALDMFLVTQATKVYSYSVYPWGSGFTFWLSKIYNLPITCKSLYHE